VTAVLLAGLAFALMLAVLRVARDAERPDARVPAAAPELAAAPAPAAPPARSARDTPVAPEVEEPGEAPPDPYEVAVRWSAVDLDAVRDAMPDNLYWQMSAPTEDEERIRWREEERARWNREYGKVLSGNATEDEIEGYYAHRERVSLDAIEFASYLLDHYRDTLPERDVGLLELAIKLHHARLQELPRRQAEAFERKQRQDVLRELWRADEQAFEKALRPE
jgi:hypothetical protein